MDTMLHIVNGDGAGNSLIDSDVPGEVLICRDLLYDGIRITGWPNITSLKSRAEFLSRLTDGEMSSNTILGTLKSQYQKLATAPKYKNIVLWFDACLCDQSMLAHILVCLRHLGVYHVDLICVDSFPGILPFNGLGQLQPSQLASLIDMRYQVTNEQFNFAEIVEKAFATQDLILFKELSNKVEAPLPFIPSAVTRWLQEQPDPATGLGKLEYLILKAVRNGRKTPGEIFTSVAQADESPQYWGDITLWQTINGLAEREPPLVQIKGPAKRLPQWESPMKSNCFEIRIAPEDAVAKSPKQSFSR